MNIIDQRSMLLNLEQMSARGEIQPLFTGKARTSGCFRAKAVCCVLCADTVHARHANSVTDS